MSTPSGPSGANTSGPSGDGVGDGGNQGSGAGSGISLLEHDALPLLSSFVSFLTVAVHSLLYHRGLYPPETFLLARAYSLPVYQSRHPGVCTWVADAMAAVRVQLRAGAVQRVVLAVLGSNSASSSSASAELREATPSSLPSLDSSDGAARGDPDEERNHGGHGHRHGHRQRHPQQPPRMAVLERWVFDVAAFPAWVPDDQKAGVLPEEAAYAMPGGEDGEVDGLAWADVNEALRGALSRLAGAAHGLDKLPEGCTFTIAVELRDEAPAPISHPQAWIPSEPDRQPPRTRRGNPKSRHPIHKASTTPVRSVQAGPLFFDCWVEHGDRDAVGRPSQAST